MSTGSPAMGGSCGEKDWPPGFRFHPTDEELVLYYLKRKICRRKIKLDIIPETDVYKGHPEELPGKSLLKNGDRQWFFFSFRERRYPNASRLSRATRRGYWKATGKDRKITCNSRNAGVKKTLVFYEGRAPNGERTDWVMHEYTLDEDELRRCNDVQDCYALYKVFKKSGPGPKNGENYGALFREEDWPDDECLDFNNSGGPEPQVKLLPEVTSVADNRENGRLLPSSDDIDDFLKQIANDPVVELPEVDDYYRTCSAVQVEDKEESGSTLVDSYPRDHHGPDEAANKMFHLNDQPSDLNPSFGFTESGISHWQSFEGEVSSAPKSCEDSCIPREEDFLEMDDLLGPAPTPSTIENAVENGLPAEWDGLSELDLFHDVDMFLRDLGPIVHEPNLDPYLDAHDDHHVGNWQHIPHSEDPMDNQLWNNDETGNAFAVPAPRSEFVSQPSLGVVGNESSNPAAEVRQTQGGSSGSRFSSNLWAFVESIPTTPASASENVNRALERMSSFSRLRLNNLNPNMVSVGDVSTGRRRRGGGLNKGFILFSVVGVLCAVFWMLGNFRLWGRRCIASS